MRFIICGAGAIGGVLGGQLAKAGLDVVLIDKLEDHVAAINAKGLDLRGVNGNHLLRVPAVRNAADITFRPDDIIFLTVKSFHSDAACAELKRATTLDLPVFCAQNGIRNEEVAARHFKQVHGVMVYIGAKRLDPGVVVDTGPGLIGFGTYPVGIDHVDEAVLEAFRKTDLDPYVTSSVMAQKWNKLIGNLGNASLGLTGFSTHEARADAECRLWMADVYEEGVRVLTAAGIRYECPAGLHPIEEQIAELRDPNFKVDVPDNEELRGRSSLWQDLAHGTGEVEADSFNGEIIRLGQLHHVPTPYSSLTQRLIEEMARAHEAPGKYSIRQLREMSGTQAMRATQ